ncbi:MAG: bleomycin resistance family protein [Acidobacteriota bacterium]|nr:bleomycin resistance family protein [Acidobacteriota bacterium]
MQAAFPSAVPEIPVKSVSAAVEYYRERLGFTVDWGGEEVGLAGVSRGHCRMFLANAEFRAERGNSAPVLIWLNLPSKEEVNALFREWTVSMSKLMSSPEMKPWGLYEFTVADLDGNLFRVFHDCGTPEMQARE